MESSDLIVGGQPEVDCYRVLEKMLMFSRERSKLCCYEIDATRSSRQYSLKNVFFVFSLYCNLVHWNSWLFCQFRFVFVGFAVLDSSIAMAWLQYMQKVRAPIHISWRLQAKNVLNI